MSDYIGLSKRIRGPVYPVLPAFYENGELDVDATQNYVNALIARGAGVIIVTAGSSRLNLLSFDEVDTLNRCTVQACDGRAIAIAGNPMTGSTEMAIELFQSAERAGADAFLAVYSERYYSDDTVFEYFASLSRACSLGLLVHAIPMRQASTGPTQVQTYSLELIERLAGIPSLVAMKEENGNEILRQQIVQRFDQRLSIILAGGGMRNYFANWSFGATAYLVGIGNFIPELEQQFFSYLKSGEIDAAREIVFSQELPFFEIAVPIGWHTALKATLSLFDLMPSYERLPMPVPNVRDITVLRDKCVELGWLD